MAVAGIIFSNIHDSSVPELTNIRTMASVPFGCRYRLIDFPLSYMVNSGINKIGIITHDNYQSLMDHIGTGKDWDLARRSGGIKILPPFISTAGVSNGGRLYTSRLEALIGAMGFINRCNEDYMVLSDCDCICNIDLDEVINEHIERNADMTIVTRPAVLGETLPAEGATVVTTDKDGLVIETEAYQRNTADVEISTNIIVVNRTFLINLLNEAISHGYKHFYRDAISRRLGQSRIYRYLYDGIYLQIASMENYFSASMKLLKNEVREGLFNAPNRPIYTKLRNSSPTIYAEGAKVTNSYVADGCVIEGEVENCILFRGVHIGKGTVVKNSVLMQDTFTGNNVMLNCVVTDKNTAIRDGRMLSGHETMPFFIPKGTMI